MWSKFGYYTFQIPNNKGIDQTAQLRRLVCALLFACYKVRFSSVKALIWIHHLYEGRIDKSIPIITVSDNWVILRTILFYPPEHKWRILFLAHLSIPDFSFENKIPHVPWIGWDPTLHDDVTLTLNWRHIMTMCITSKTTNVQTTCVIQGEITIVKMSNLNSKR